MYEVKGQEFESREEAESYAKTASRTLGQSFFSVTKDGETVSEYHQGSKVQS